MSGPFLMPMSLIPDLKLSLLRHSVMISSYSYTFIIRLFFVYLDGSHFAILHTKLYDLGPNIQSTIVTYNTDCHHNIKLFRFFTTGLVFTNSVVSSRNFFFANYTLQQIQLQYSLLVDRPNTSLGRNPV